MAKKSTSPFVPGVGGTHASKIMQSLSVSPGNLSRWVHLIVLSSKFPLVSQKKRKALSKVKSWILDVFKCNWFSSLCRFVCQSTVEECWMPKIQLRPLSHSRIRDSCPLWLPPPLLWPTRWPPSHISPHTVPRPTASSTWHTPVNLPVWIASDLQKQTCTEERTPFSHLYCTISDAWRGDAKSTAR